MFSSGMPRIWNSVRYSSAHLQDCDSSSQSHQPSSSSTPLKQHQKQQRSSFKSALEHVSVPDSLFRGINVYKINAKGKLEPAVLTISNDKFVISVLPRTYPLLSSRPMIAERNGSNASSSNVSNGIGVVSGLKRPGILTRGRSANTSQGSVGGGSIGTMGSMEGDYGFSFNPDTSIDIGSIDRIQSGQNTLLFEKAR